MRTKCAFYRKIRKMQPISGSLAQLPSEMHPACFCSLRRLVPTLLSESVQKSEEVSTAYSNGGNVSCVPFAARKIETGFRPSPLTTSVHPMLLS